MTAKDMFEKLGFKECTNDEYKIVYQYKDTIRQIWFFKKNKNIVFSEFEGFDMELLKSINKQVEELNWNE